MKKQFFAILMVATLGLSACGGAVFRPVQFAFEDRSAQQQVEDNQIDLAIMDRLRKADPSLLLDVNLDVWEGRVMLTGTVDSAERKEKIRKIAEQDGRIVTVYNAIQIVSPDVVSSRRMEVAKAKAGEVGQSLSDVWIEQKIGARLVATKNVAAINYRWRSVNNRVYVIGRASSPAEKVRVLNTIRTTSGVSRVTEYIWSSS